MEEAKQIIKDYIKSEIESRLYDKRGGAAHDYANFCVHNDFDWLREEIESDFNYIVDNTRKDVARELDLEVSEAEDLIYDECMDFIEREKLKILNEIEELSYSVGTHKIHEHVVNEVENRFKEPAEALKELEDMLIEKGVVSDLEELEEIESYQNAVAFINNSNTSKKSNNKVEENIVLGKIGSHIEYLIVVKNEGKKFIKKKIKRALKDKIITNKEESYLLSMLENRNNLSDSEKIDFFTRQMADILKHGSAEVLDMLDKTENREVYDHKYKLETYIALEEYFNLGDSLKGGLILKDKLKDYINIDKKTINTKSFLNFIAEELSYDNLKINIDYKENQLVLTSIEYMENNNKVLLEDKGGSEGLVYLINFLRDPVVQYRTFIGKPIKDIQD